MPPIIIEELVVLSGLSIAVILLSHWAKVHPIIGFILTGMFAGPYGLGLVSNTARVETLSQIGIILLLFGIGMESSIRMLKSMGRLFFLGGTLQVGLTVIGGMAIGMAVGRSMGESLFLGCLLSLSSTAIVLKLLSEKRELSSAHGRASMAILIYQDLIAVVMIVMVPVMAEPGLKEVGAGPLLFLFGKGALVLMGIWLLAERIVPKLFYYVAKTRSREIFLLTICFICFAATWLGAALGLTMSFGAFLAGLVLADSEYRHQVIGHVLPLQDILLSLFFISVGMLVDTHFILQHLGLVVGLSLLVMISKALIVGFVGVILKLSLRTVVITALSLAQIGEFSFVLLKSGFDHGLGSAYLHQLFLGVALLTMALTPILAGIGDPIAAYLQRSWLLRRVGYVGCPVPVDAESVLKQHVIIMGFGLAGRYLARSCKIARIPYVIAEVNPEIVRRERRKGEPIRYCDGTHIGALESLSIDSAKAIAIAVDDPAATRLIVKAARHHNKSVYILAQSVHLSELDTLRNLGADEVIVEEVEASLMVLTRLLERCGTPKADTAELLTLIRREWRDLYHYRS